MQYFFGLGFLSAWGLSPGLCFSLAQGAGKMWSLLIVHQIFPMMLFVSRDLGGGALGACHSDFLIFS